MAQSLPYPSVHGVEISGDVPAQFEALLAPEAIEFVARLERRFRDTRNFLLMLAQETRERLLDGVRPGFLPETAPIRSFDWKVAPLPDDLVDRRVELVTPPTRRALGTALGAGARTIVVDLDDAMQPSWTVALEAQLLLRAVARGELRAIDPRTLLPLAHAGRPPVLMLRPRGWAASEPGLRVDGLPVSAALLDFGLYFWHNARVLVSRATAPYFYLGRIESHLEARLWNNVFVQAQDALGLRRGTIKAGVTIDSVLAAFEMDEILYQLREHSAGLAFGRQSVVLSYLKRLGHDAAWILPDGACDRLDWQALRSCRDLLVRTCHRRGVHAIGGLSPLQLSASEATRNASEIARLRDDTWRDVATGFDGAQVAHPLLAPVVAREFESPNQIDRLRADVEVAASDLLLPPRGPRTGAGLRQEVRLALVYLHAWQGGDAWPALEDRIVTRAMAETARSHVWQWLSHGVVLDDGTRVTRDLVDRLIREDVDRLTIGLGEGSPRRASLQAAAVALVDLVHAARCPESLELAGPKRLAG